MRVGVSSGPCTARQPGAARMHIMYAHGAYYARGECILCTPESLESAYCARRICILCTWEVSCGPCTCILCIFCLLCIRKLVTYGTRGRAEKSLVPTGLYAVAISLRIVHALGIRKNQYVRFAVSKNKVIIKLVESNITKKDVAQGRPELCLSRQVWEEEDTGYMGDLAEALARNPNDSGSGRIEKLRVK